MAEELSRLEATLVDAAKAGNVEHIIALLRDVGRLHHLWQPNAAQAQAIANAASTVLRKPAAAARGGGEGAEFDESQVTDLQQDAPVVETRAAAITAKGERLLKGYMVSSVNEWGADQTRILLLTDEGIHRVKYNFSTDQVLKHHTDTYDKILRVEYGNFKASTSSIMSFLWRHEIDDQQGLRVYTSAPARPAGAGDGVGGSEEAFREYRALLAESEPWKEEVFMLEIVAALQAIKILYKASFEIKLTKMIKNIPGGVFTLLHNANRRRQHGSC